MKTSFKLFVLVLAVSLVTAAFTPLGVKSANANADECELGPWDKCPGAKENPLDPATLEGEYVRVLYYVGKEPGPDSYSLVLVRRAGSEDWVKVGISIEMRLPEIVDGVTAYGYDGLRYAFDDYTGPVPAEFVGIWRNHTEYPGDIVDVYVPYVQTPKDQQISAYYKAFGKAVTRVLYDGQWTEGPWDDSPYAACNTMLTRFWSTRWGEDTYARLFELCEGEKVNPRSVGYYQNVYGMGTGITYYSQEDGRGVQVMSFLRRPPYSLGVGTLTPCSDPFYLYRGLEFDHVELKEGSFATVYSSWKFNTGGVDVVLYNHLRDSFDSVTVVDGTYVAFLPAEQDTSVEWSPVDNTNTLPLLKLYQVKFTCR